MAMTAKITSKGQITVPVRIRRALGVGAGDQLAFKQRKNGEILVMPVRAESPFARYCGIDGLGPGPGREVVMKYMRELRGE